MKPSLPVFFTSLFLMLIAVQSRAETIHLMGLANLQCRDFNFAAVQNTREPPVSFQWVEYRHYISGYFTGFNTASGLMGGGSDLGKGTSLDQMMNWLTAFCADNAQKSMNEAIQTLAQAIARKQSSK
jgi:hypothetical protein